MTTSEQYSHIARLCRTVFEKKLVDYGAAWRILRPSSLTDQLYIKARRIRQIEITSVQQIPDDIRSEYIGIVNYALIALIQCRYLPVDQPELTTETALQHYDDFLSQAQELMERKNHDYGEAWRMMRMSSYTDLILTKLLRVKQIEDNAGQTLVSEGVEANYFDMINYSIFALIKIEKL